MSTELVEKIKWVIYQNKNFYILDLGDGKKAKGHILDNMQADIKGMTYRFIGDWVNDKYGRIFKFDNAEMQTDELLFFLANVVKGIGEAMACLMIERFGDELEFVLDNTPWKLKQIPGIGDKRLEKIVKSWQKHSHLRKLSDFFSDFNISSDLVSKIYNVFKDDSVVLVKSNPYIITEIPGFTFEKADDIAKIMGVENDSPHRMRACAVNILKNTAYESGHTYIEENTFLNICLKKLSLDESYYENLKDILYNFSELMFFDENKVTLKDMFKWEKTVYDFVNEKSNMKNNFFTPEYVNSFIKDHEEQYNIKLSDKQKEAVHKAVNTKVFALTGYAGTGKTTVSKIFYDLLKTIFEGKIVGCAMSGIAARRLENVTEIPSYTIHSLLAFDGKDFQYNRFNPLEYKVIILDEAGMVNSELFYSLIRAVEKETIFIMIGDDAQLPPIGPGNVFSDLISKSIVPYVKLEDIFRQDKNSVLNIFANMIRHGNTPEDFTNTYNDWYFRNISIDNEYYGMGSFKINNERILKNIKKIVMDYLAKGIDNMLTSLQILSPMKKGILGTQNLNQNLQKIYNNPSLHNTENTIIRKNLIFSKGDKVVHLKNSDMNVWEENRFSIDRSYRDTPEIKRVFNGTTGIIEYISHKNSKLYVHTITDEIVEYDFTQINELLDLSYALTVHKCQGSEFDVVIFPLTLSHKIMLDNQLLYTGITRAKKGIILVGECDAFTFGCENNIKKFRNTLIPEINR